MTEGMGWVRKWTVVMRYKLKICYSTRISMASDVDGTARRQCTTRSSEGEETYSVCTQMPFRAAPFLFVDKKHSLVMEIILFYYFRPIIQWYVKKLSYMSLRYWSKIAKSYIFPLHENFSPTNWWQVKLQLCKQRSCIEAKYGNQKNKLQVNKA